MLVINLARILMISPRHDIIMLTLLTREKITFDDFIDLKLKKFNGLILLRDAYGKLLEKYSRALSDEPESRLAVEVMLHNMERLQVAIGGMHEQTIDVVDTIKMKEFIQSFMKHLTSGLKTGVRGAGTYN